ncbi:MAG: hypothetical protein HYX73_05800 [Acidobacteria bacterium]|nr:hypothetical protein [Acidobacteriota bacterium]
MLFRPVLRILLTLTALPVLAQAPASDPQAVDLLRQVLNISGAMSNPFNTFTAHGTITYYWGVQPVQSPATIRARGSDQFRLDANLPDGIRSVSTSKRGGSRKEPDGKLSDIPAHNTVNSGILTLPYPSIAAHLADADVTISYVGQVDNGGRPAHQVRVTRKFSNDADPDGILAALFRSDYFIDAQTFLLMRIEDSTHPVQSMTETYPHAIEFEEYTAASGIAVPALVREKVGGQTTWEFRLSDIRFNTNLQDGDFSLQ